ncbi:MAG TPA: hypothetical protein VIX40_08680 [Methylomirabilota bacterium]
MNRPGPLAAWPVVLLAASALAGAGACRKRSREPLLTYFNAEHALTVRYPASWRTDQAEQDGVWYRYFLGPASGPQKKPEVSVTLLAGPLGVELDEYAEAYLAGNKLQSSRDEERQDARGRSYVFGSADGAMRYSLLLLSQGGKVYGLYAQGEAAGFERHQGAVEEMQKSLTLEHPASWKRVTDPVFGFSLRLPASWTESRRFAGAGTLLLQYTSPPLAADRGGQTVHAALTVTVEALSQEGLEPFYQATRAKLGEAFQVAHHEPWGDGYVDVMRSETPVSVSRVKRFYRTVGRRGYSLTFESRDDVYVRVFRWYDLVASTFKTGAEAEQ